ncbi:serine-threonine kinase receptor-associated protein-like [Oppia nitens]|uniref:serine-threonine kinase receptor-associated protein-like n=1 Tax=Oppia nitens TaxID=1686743 RepID=UPI0023DBB960|nr:serine-threonine kinase receptor-associated protein-like [Oppia nitens]
MATLRQTPLTCSGHTRPVVHLQFSPITASGSYMISASKDGKPMLRKGETGDWIGTFEGHKGAVWGVALSSDIQRAATGAADFCAKIWDAVTGQELHTLSHAHIVKTVDFSNDDKFLATGSNDKLIRIYDLNKIDSDPMTINGHTSSIRHVLFTNNSQLLISASEDKTVRFWDKNTKEEIKKLEFNTIPYSIELSRDSKMLSICYGNNVMFYDMESMSQLKEFKIPTHVLSATLHPDKSVFVCGGEDFKMYKYDYNSGSELESFKGHFGGVHCVRFSPDGELYASGSEDGTLRLWQTTVGKTYGLWKCVNNDENDLNNENNINIENHNISNN